MTWYHEPPKALSRQVVVLNHSGSGSTWIEALLNHYHNGIIKTRSYLSIGSIALPFTDEQSFTRDKLILESNLLIYLRRDPYDIYFSNITKSLKRKPKFKYGLMKNELRRLPAKIILHHLSALDLAKVHPNFFLLDYEKLNSENGMEEFSKVCPEIDIKTWESFSYKNILEKSQTSRSFELEYKFISQNKLNGGLVGQGKKFLKPVQMERLEKVINKYDYWNKMKELDDLVS